MDASLMEMGFKMSLALGAVLLTFAGAIFLVRKFSGVSGKLGLNGKGRQKPKPIEILSHKALGPGKNIYLIKCQGKSVLLGSTAQQITQLMVFDEEGAENEETDFESSLQDNTEGGREGGLRRQLGSKLKEISRV